MYDLRKLSKEERKIFSKRVPIKAKTYAVYESGLEDFFYTSIDAFGYDREGDVKKLLYTFTGIMGEIK